MATSTHPYHGQFSRGTVVRIRENTNLPHNPGKLFMIRCSFPYETLKEDVKESMRYLTFEDSTPIYMASDVRGRSFFLPEYYKDGILKGKVQCLEVATPVEEAIMICREELRHLSQKLCGDTGMTPDGGYPVKLTKKVDKPHRSPSRRPRTSPARGWTDDPVDPAAQPTPSETSQDETSSGVMDISGERRETRW